MKRLNFYPYYELLLRSREKTTTLRLRNREALEEGDEVMLSVGWDENNAVHLHRGKIRRVYRRRVSQLSQEDLEGESPDCKTPASAQLVLSSIYRTVVGPDDEVWVVKFDHA